MNICLVLQPHEIPMPVPPHEVLWVAITIVYSCYKANPSRRTMKQSLLMESKLQRESWSCSLRRYWNPLLLIPRWAIVLSSRLRALQIAFEQVPKSQNDKFIIFSYSPTVLQPLRGCEHGNLQLMLILKECRECIRNKQNAVIQWWIPSYIGIPGNEAAEKAVIAASNLPFTEIDMHYEEHKLHI